MARYPSDPSTDRVAAAVAAPPRLHRPWYPRAPWRVRDAWRGWCRAGRRRTPSSLGRGRRGPCGWSPQDWRAGVAGGVRAAGGGSRDDGEACPAALVPRHLGRYSGLKDVARVAGSRDRAASVAAPTEGTTGLLDLLVITGARGDSIRRAVKSWNIAALVVLIAVGGTVGALAAAQTTSNVQVRVWQRVSDGSLFG